jgi:Reverse transcriptase (RNA-dependent DNA polymerase)
MPLPIHAGVPQGSPLSPILFILYITSMYEALEAVVKISVIGFADGTNIIAFGQTVPENCRTLERAWAVCEKWSESRGMEFEPGKASLSQGHETR